MQVWASLVLGLVNALLILGGASRGSFRPPCPDPLFDSRRRLDGTPLTGPKIAARTSHALRRQPMMIESGCHDGIDAPRSASMPG